MSTFSYIVNPRTISQFKQLRMATLFLPDFLFNSQFQAQAPFLASRIRPIMSINKKEAHGYIIACPMPEKAPQSEIIDKLSSCLRLAAETGAGVIGVDGILEHLLDNEKTLLKKIRVPVTSGCAFTSWAVFEGIYRIAVMKKMDLHSLTVCLEGLAKPFLELSRKKLEDAFPGIRFTNDPNKADITLYRDFQPGLIKLPYPVQIKLGLGLAEGIIPAALAETVLLALEDKNYAYPVSADINLDNLEEIANIAVRHGFEVWVPEAPIL